VSCILKGAASNMRWTRCVESWKWLQCSVFAEVMQFTAAGHSGIQRAIRRCTVYVTRKSAANRIAADSFLQVFHLMIQCALLRPCMCSCVQYLLCMGYTFKVHCTERRNWMVSIPWFVSCVSIFFTSVPGDRLYSLDILIVYLSSSW
jgi:hypothetical protein